MHYIFIALDKVHEELGTGHVIRTSKILELMFATSSKNIITLFSNNIDLINKYNGIYIENAIKGNKAVKNFINERSIDVVFLDCLDYFQDIYSVCKKKNIISICVDISEKGLILPDLIINPVIENQNAFLSGPLYSLHYEIDAKSFVSFDKRKKSIFVCFGGIDFQNYLSKIIPYLKNSLSNYIINIVVSQSSDLECYKNLPKNIKLHFKPNNFYDLLQNSALALISGGVILQEALYLGVPSIVFPQYDHQYRVAKKKKSEGSLVEVFQFDEILKNISSIIESNINEPLFLKKASLSGRSSDDGFGVKRVVNILQIIEHLEWDSNFFKKNIYNITSKFFSERIEQRLNTLIKNQHVDLIYFLCPKADKNSIRNATNNGFIQVDQRLTYLIKANEYLARELNSNSYKKYSIIKSTVKDASDLGALAKSIHWTTRYTNDENFDIQSIKKFYEEWVTKSIVGKLDDAVYHIKQSGKICGFISIKKMGINMGSIGLVGVSSDFQGKGIGAELTNFAVDYMFNSMDCASVQVVTQETNIGACKTYEKIGFNPSDRSIWFHKWIDKK